jgi:uncharacterized protein
MRMHKTAPASGATAKTARSASEWLGLATNRLYPRMTHRAGAELVAAAPTGALDDLDRRKYCAVVSYRRDGEAVSTPVWFGTDDGKLYFRSLAGGYKLKRIARDDRVRVAPCTRRGRPVGPPFEGRARILEPAEAEAAERRIQANYGAFRRLYERAIKDADARYVEITPLR